MTNENKCPVAEQACKPNCKPNLSEYSVTPDGTLVETADIVDNPTAFTDVIS
jgi:hypothetical protein